MPPEPSGALTRELASPPARVLAAIAEAAEAWGGEWSAATAGGRLTIPCQRGLRRGVLVARIAAAAQGHGTRLELHQIEETLLLNTPATVVLGLAAGGGIATAVWPFVPALLPVLPLATVLALGGWFLVASRIRSVGLGDFLSEVEARLAEPPDAAGESATGESATPGSRYTA